jgi:hypothetical protein
MKNMKEILSHAWDFSLYEVDGKKILTVIFMDRIDYPRSFYILKEEEGLSLDGFIQLSRKIRNNYEDYKYREIVPPVFE